MPTKIYKQKDFGKFTKKNRISDEDLKSAVAEIEDGLVDADLGGGVVKKRIASNGRGKSGGFRTILLLKRGTRVIFVHGFSKGKKSNISDDELDGFKKVADYFLNMSDDKFAIFVNDGDFTEVER